MTDRFQNYRELQGANLEGIDYRIETAIRSRNHESIGQSALERAKSIIILGVHAGGIEPGTSELARSIAGEDFSLYLFEGITGNNKVLHITSTHFDEPRCTELVKNHHSSVSLHGFIESPSDPCVYVGGKDIGLKQQILSNLMNNGFSTEINTGKYAATAAGNICNRTSSGQGVQIEIAKGLRTQFFEDYSSRRGRENTTASFESFVKAIRNTLLNDSLGRQDHYR